MPVKTQDQISIDDRIVENPQLEDALEQREKRKASRSALNAQFREADKHAKALIGELAIGEDQVVRVGRFVIKRSPVEGRSVEFETEPTERLTISTVGE